jgi:hypothetical protein
MTTLSGVVKYIFTFVKGRFPTRCRRLRFPKADTHCRGYSVMRPQLTAGNAFVAVGALHLYGEYGLLVLLARDGYHVTRV